MLNAYFCFSSASTSTRLAAAGHLPLGFPVWRARGLERLRETVHFHLAGRTQVVFAGTNRYGSAFADGLPQCKPLRKSTMAVANRTCQNLFGIETGLVRICLKAKQDLLESAWNRKPRLIRVTSGDRQLVLVFHALASWAQTDPGFQCPLDRSYDAIRARGGAAQPPASMQGGKNDIE